MQFGYVDGVFPENDLVPQSIAFAADLAKKKTRTYAEMKRRIRVDIARILDEVDPGQFGNTLTFAMPG
jgi:hypothetical protein